MVLNWIFYPYKQSEIENPNRLVYAHVAIKGVQAGLVLGSIAGVAHNIFHIYYSRTEKTFNWDRFCRYTRNGILPLTIIASVACQRILSSSDLSKNQSRAFRIFHNNGQNLSDDLTLGGILGGVLYSIIKKQMSTKQICISASVGGLIGLLIDFGVVATRGLSNSSS